MQETANKQKRITQKTVHQSFDEKCHRFLNAVEPGTQVPIHRHKSTSETCVCIRGHFEEYFYDGNGNLTIFYTQIPKGSATEKKNAVTSTLSLKNPSDCEKSCIFAPTNGR